MDIYIFNELSSPFATIIEAKEQLATFINTCFKARGLGFEALHLPEGGRDNSCHASISL